MEINLIFLSILLASLILALFRLFEKPWLTALTAKIIFFGVILLIIGVGPVKPVAWVCYFGGVIACAWGNEMRKLERKNFTSALRMALEEDRMNSVIRRETRQAKYI